MKRRTRTKIFHRTINRCDSHQSILVVDISGARSIYLLRPGPPAAIKLPNHIYNGSLGEGIHDEEKKTMSQEDRADTGLMEGEMNNEYHWMPRKKKKNYV